MSFSRPPRNRYRRRPSRLTALGKGVVGATMGALLALGWASQASRRNERPASGDETVESRPVSAPPRWLGGPGFDSLAAPSSEAEPAASAASVTAASSTPPGSTEPSTWEPTDPAALGASPADPTALDAATRATSDPTSDPVQGPSLAGRPAGDPAVHPGSALAMDPASDLPAAPAPELEAPASPVALTLPFASAPTSLSRFEQARRAMREARDPAALARHASSEAGGQAVSTSADGGPPAALGGGRRRLSEWLDPAQLGLAGQAAAPALAPGPVRVDYSLDEALTAKVFDILRQGRVERGIAIVIDPRSGRLLAYASTDPDVLPVEHVYPAASIVKVVTASAMLEQRPDPTGWDCLYEGNKYRLSQRRLDVPRRGHHATLEEAIATSNNQCFSQWAIHSLGEPRLRRMLESFGWTRVPARGHSAGRVDPAATRYDLGQLGSGLDGVRVTPLHVASLASVLTDGRLVAPRWIDRVVDARGHVLSQPPAVPPRRVVSARTAENLRDLMVATTKRGTARRAFRSRRGIPVLGAIEVAGKTGNLNGRNPSGRYEWFFGVAPASDPQIGVVVMQVHGHLWWSRSSEVAANILRNVFCEGASCRPELASRFTGARGDAHATVLVSDLEQSSNSSVRR